MAAGTPQPVPRGVLSSVQSSPQIGGSQQEAWLDAQISKAYNAGFQRGASHASDPVSENMPPVRLDLLESRGCSPVAERYITNHGDSKSWSIPTVLSALRFVYAQIVFWAPNGKFQPFGQLSQI